MQSWNVDIVLDHLVASGPNLQLGLNYLAAKTVTLILMARMCRIGEVSQLNTDYMHEGKDYLEFWLPQPCKTVTVTNHARRLDLQKLRITQFSDRRLCPVAAMKTYLHRTRAVRGKISKVFIIISNEPRPASPQSLSRWVKTLMQDAGLDKYTPQQIRSQHMCHVIRLTNQFYFETGWMDHIKYIYQTLYENAGNTHN